MARRTPGCCWLPAKVLEAEFLLSMTVHCQSWFAFGDRLLGKRRTPCESDPAAALGDAASDDIFAVEIGIAAFVGANSGLAVVVVVVAEAHLTAAVDSFAASEWIQGAFVYPLTSARVHWIGSRCAPPRIGERY